MITSIEIALTLGMIFLLIVVNQQGKIINDKDLLIKVKDQYIRDLISRIRNDKNTI